MTNENTEKPMTTAIVSWADELAKQANIASTMEEGSATGQFFGTKGGILTWDDAPLQGNQMAVVIIDSIMENVYYEGIYDPDNPAGPVCFSHGRDEATMVPHHTVFENETAQSDACTGCPMNEWASAPTGRGKACKNSRRIAMIPAGTFDRNGNFTQFEDPEHYAEAGTGYMRLPVTSVKGYATFVRQVAGSLKRPPHGIITRVKLVPDAKTQFRVVFEAMSSLPDELMSVIMQRNAEAKELIEFHYTLKDPNEVKEPPASKAAKQPAKSRKY